MGSNSNKPSPAKLREDRKQDGWSYKQTRWIELRIRIFFGSPVQICGWYLHFYSFWTLYSVLSTSHLHPLRLWVPLCYHSRYWRLLIPLVTQGAHRPDVAFRRTR